MEEQIVKKGNVLVIGNSGVGKSTLINAVLGEDVAYTNCGTKGSTVELKIYDNEASPFRLIDTVGFEPTFLKRQAAIDAVKKWSKNCAKAGCEDNQVNIIWFCVDGTARKLFADTVKALCSAIKIWKDVPVIAVITKSYSMPDREENIKMVYQAFAEQKNCISLREVIPVVAQDYIINEGMSVAPNGIAELIHATEKLMPEGLTVSPAIVEKMVLDRSRALSQGSIVAASAAAAGVGLAPIPIPDSSVLVPIETAMINGITKIYGINDKEQRAMFASSLIEVGAVSLTAKGIIQALKAIPYINLAAAVINAITAGVLCTALGELTVVACEKIYKGEESLSNLEWVKNLMTPEKMKQVQELGEKMAKSVAGQTGKIDWEKLFGSVFLTKKNIQK